MKQIMSLIVIFLATVFSLTGFAQSISNSVGSRISKGPDNTPIQYMTKKELTTLLTGKTFKGKTYKEKKKNQYHTIVFNADGTALWKVYKNNSKDLIKKNNLLWSVKEDGVLCYEFPSVKYCNKKVTAIGDQYYTVLTNNNMIFSSWVIKK